MTFAGTTPSTLVRQDGCAEPTQYLCKAPPCRSDPTAPAGTTSLSTYSEPPCHSKQTSALLTCSFCKSYLSPWGNWKIITKTTPRSLGASLEPASKTSGSRPGTHFLFKNREMRQPQVSQVREQNLFSEHTASPGPAQAPSLGS